MCGRCRVETDRTRDSDRKNLAPLHQAVDLLGGRCQYIGQFLDCKGLTLTLDLRGGIDRCVHKDQFRSDDDPALLGDVFVKTR